MSLSNLSNHLAGSPVRPLAEAQLITVAAAAIRNSSTTPERRVWASNVLSNPAAACDQRVMGMLITNPTIFAALEADTVPPDSDIEYVITAEVLPLIAPA